MPTVYRETITDEEIEEDQAHKEWFHKSFGPYFAANIDRLKAENPDIPTEGLYYLAVEDMVMSKNK